MFACSTNITVNTKRGLYANQHGIKNAMSYMKMYISACCNIKMLLNKSSFKGRKAGFTVLSLSKQVGSLVSMTGLLF